MTVVEEIEEHKMADIIERMLNEEIGVYPRTDVKKRRDVYTNHTSFIARINVVDNRFQFNISITDEAIDTYGLDDIDELLEYFCSDAVYEIRDNLVSDYHLDRRRFEIFPYNNAWARCLSCGKMIHFWDVYSRGLGLSSLESMSTDITPTTIDRLGDTSRTMLELALLGKLLDTCKQPCPNAPSTHRNI